MQSVSHNCDHAILERQKKKKKNVEKDFIKQN